MTSATSAITSASLRKTAALRFVLDEMQVTDLMERLDGSHESLGMECERLSQAKQNYDIAKSYLEERRNEITMSLVEKLTDGDPKLSQAAIDRAVKAELISDELMIEREQKVLEEKNDLDDAQGDFDAAKSNQRVLLAKAQLTASTLQYLSASKTARATALAHMADL